MDNDNTQSYQIHLGNKEYILTVQSMNGMLILECQDNNFSDYPYFTKGFSLTDLKNIDNYFTSFSSLEQIQYELTKLMQDKKVSINNIGNIVGIDFYLPSNEGFQKITLNLFRQSNIQKQIQNVNRQTNQNNGNIEYQGRCSCPLDNERLDKLESENSLIKKEHSSFRNELNKLINKINALNQLIINLKKENQELNKLTNEFKDENNSRREEASKLRRNNESIKRENQKLKEKKNQLEFLLKEHHLNITKNPFNSFQVLKVGQTYKNDRLETNINNIPEQQNCNYTEESKEIVNSILLNKNVSKKPGATVSGEIIHTSSELEMICQQINKKNQRITISLIYKASVDSDKAEAFHRKCDNSSSTLVVVETKNGKRFGGYTSCSWQGNCIDKKDPDAFIFSLDKMKSYSIKPNNDAIGCYPTFGPVFFGCQIRIYDKAFTNGGSTFEKGLNYETTEDYELTGGEQYFSIKEIEVYDIKFS